MDHSWVILGIRSPHLACAGQPPAAGLYCEGSELLSGHEMSLLTTLLLAAMLATLVVLVVGLIGFFHGGEFNRKYGNKLMRARVALQAVAVALLLLVLMTSS